MAGLLPPVIATLIADTKQYMVKMTEAQAKMGEFGEQSETSADMFAGAAGTIATAAVAAGVAIGAYAVDKAYKFQEAMDKIQNQAGLTAEQTDKLGASIKNISSATGIATTDLAGAALTVEQAGIKGAKATNLLTAAAKAAVITNASVADTTKAIVAAQTLQITKGMEVSKLTGILVKGSRDFVGGLSAEEQMLSGRVGVALAKYGFNLQTIIPLGAEFAKVGLPTRSISSFANALGNLEKPLTDSKGKLTSYAQGLEKVGLSQQKLASDLRVGNVTGILKDIKQAAQESGEPLSQIVDAVFGNAGGATASVLIKNLQDLANAQKNLQGAGASSLQTGFSTALKQLGPQLNLLKAQLNVLMINAGKLLLPALTDVAKWGNSVFTWFKDHPLLGDIAGGAAITAFAGALAYKVGKAMKAVFSVGSDIFKGVQTVLGKLGIGNGPNVQLDANTTALNRNTEALLGRPVGGSSLPSSTSGGAGLLSAAAITAAGAALAVYAASHGPNPLGSANVHKQSRFPMPIVTVKNNTTAKIKNR